MKIRKCQWYVVDKKRSNISESSPKWGKTFFFRVHLTESTCFIFFLSQRADWNLLMAQFNFFSLLNLRVEFLWVRKLFAAFKKIISHFQVFLQKWSFVFFIHLSHTDESLNVSIPSTAASNANFKIYILVWSDKNLFNISPERKFFNLFCSLTHKRIYTRCALSAKSSYFSICLILTGKLHIDDDVIDDEHRKL